MRYQSKCQCTVVQMIIRRVLFLDKKHSLLFESKSFGAMIVISRFFTKFAS